MLADSHCHLDLFKNPKKIVSAAFNQGVTKILSASTSQESISQNIELSKKFVSVDCALGLHPVDILSMKKEDVEKAISFVEKNVSNSCAIGEVGVDFKYASVEQRGFQEKVFRRFIKIAIENKKPLVIHTRYADTKCLDILEKEGAEKVLMHWFTNSKKTSKRAIDLNYYISCGPIIFSDEQSQKVVSEIPDENLLLETDAPVKFQGKEAEPSWIPKVCEKVAELKETSFEEISKKTEKNYSLLFKKL